MLKCFAIYSNGELKTYIAHYSKEEAFAEVMKEFPFAEVKEMSKASVNVCFEKYSTMKCKYACEKRLLLDFGEMIRVLVSNYKQRKEAIENGTKNI